MRAVIYARVSSLQQEDGASLDTQVEHGLKDAAEHNDHVVRIFREVHSGVDLWGRDDLTELRDMVRKKETDVVICHAIDRLARDPIHLGVVLTEAEHVGVEVRFVTEPLDLSPEGMLIRYVRGYAAKIEHEKIKERTMRGRVARAKNGMPLVGPRPPFGYSWVCRRDGKKDKKVGLALDDETAPIVRRIFDEFADGGSSYEIARRLTQEGVPTPTRKRKGWAPSSVRQMVKTPAYWGEAVAFDPRLRRPSDKDKRAVDAPIPVSVPSIVDKDVAERALERLAHNKNDAKRNNHSVESALLRGGLLRCPYCNTAFTVANYVGDTFRPTYRSRCAPHHGCPKTEVSANVIDTLVWDDLRTLLDDEDAIKDAMREHAESDPSKDNRAALANRRTVLEQRQTNLVRRLALVDDDVAVLVAAELGRLRDELNGIDGELAKLHASYEAWRVAKDFYDDFEAWRLTVRLNFDGLAYQQRRDLLTLLDATVVVWPKGTKGKGDRTYEIRLNADGIVNGTRASTIHNLMLYRTLGGWSWERSAA